MPRFLIAGALFLALASPALAQPACTSAAPNAPACQGQATNPQPTDIVLGQQATGPSRSNQTVKFSLSQLGGTGSSSSGQLLMNSASTVAGVTVGSGLSLSSGTLSATGGGGGSGTVTSVGLTMPSGFSVSGSPITGSGTFAVSLTGGSGQILYNNSGAIGGVTVGSGLSFSGGTLSATGGGGGSGTVTSVGLTMPAPFTVNNTPITSSGTIGVVLNGTGSWGAGQAVMPAALTDSATITPNFSVSNNFTVTIAGNRTLGNPINVIPGECGWLAVQQDATGSRTLTWGGNWKWSSGTPPTLSTAGTKTDLISFCAISSSVVAAQLAISNF